MLITRLHLKNFRSYGRADLDLSDLRAATIVGRNGAGKSTLAVDAMLWALYGQVRGTGADSVVRIGETDCVVELDFEASGHAYRVLRKRTTRSRGKSELDLYRLQAGVPVPMSGKTIDDTQAEIERVVGVGLETLVAASVIQQGDAARFTSAAPEERRRILRSILGLERYKTMAQDARQRAAVVQGQVAALQRDLDVGAALDERLAAAHEEALTSAQYEEWEATVTASCDQKEQAARQREADARAALQAEQVRLAERPALLARLAAATRAYEDAESQAAFLSVSADLRQIVAAEFAIGTAQRQVADAEEAHDAARRARDARAELQRQARDLEDQIEAALRRQPRVSSVDLAMARQAVEFVRQGEGLVADARAASEKARYELQRQQDLATQVDHDPDLVRLQLEIDAARAESERLTREAQDLDPGADAVSKAFGRLQAAQRDLAAAEKAAGLLDEAPCAKPFQPGTLPKNGRGQRWMLKWEHGSGLVMDELDPVDLVGTCPLLANAREARDALPNLRAQIEDADAHHGQVQVALQASRETQAKAAAQHREALQAEGDWRRLRADVVARDRVEIDAASKRLREADAARTKAEGELDSYRQVAARLPKLEADAAQAAAVGAEIAALRARLGKARVEADAAGGASVADTADALSRARSNMARLERIIAGREAAERAAAQLVEARAAADRAADAVAEARTALDACRPDEAVAARATQAAAELREAMAEAGAQRVRHREAVAALERARAEVTRLEAEVAALAEKHAEALRLAEDARMWTRTAEALELAAVLLIERAVPVIEAEANAVLARISSRGMQVRLDTQRALKSRDGVRETLGITIRDDIGERPYEDFSGGEQFRVDMALRLALARLLADREGVPVEQLVIDEGAFGALDQEGVGALKEVLAGLQSVYRLILVVTHIPEVADALPHRIEVVQGANGSEIVGAGGGARRAA